MDFKGFVEKAKEAAAAAMAPPSGETTTPEQADAAPESESGQVKSFAALTAEKLAEFKELGSEKLQALMASFQQALPAIRTAGYELTEFEVELSLTPKLIPHFRHAPKAIEDVERAREEVRGNRLGTLILNGLLKAGEAHRQIKVAGFAFSHIEIELGVVPCVRLQYKNEGDVRAEQSLPQISSAEPLAITDATARSSSAA